MSKASDAFNALPYKERLIGAMSECELRIQHLEFEKKRLKKRYATSIEEINEHIQNVEMELRRKEKEYDKLFAGSS